MDYGIKVSRDGYDVKTVPSTAANIKKFCLLSGIPLLKIKTATKISLANSASTNIAHGLAYKPICWVFMKDGSNDLIPIYYNTSSTYAYVDATYLTIRNSDGATRDFYYYIFHDPV